VITSSTKKHKHRASWQFIDEPVAKPKAKSNLLGALATVGAAIARHHQAHHRHHHEKNIDARRGSTCFSNLAYSPGLHGVHAIFTDGTYHFYPMSREEAMEWFDDPSLGKFFNAEVR
jgi:hypothetical protein